MTGLWWCALALLVSALDSPDWREIRKLIDSLNDADSATAAFSIQTNSETELGKLAGIHNAVRPRWVVIGMDEPWTQLTTPTITLGRIRSLTPESAEVEGSSRVSGAMMLRREVPLRFVLRRESGEWRIVEIKPMGR